MFIFPYKAADTFTRNILTSIELHLIKSTFPYRQIEGELIPMLRRFDMRFYVYNPELSYNDTLREEIFARRNFGKFAPNSRK